VKVLARQRRPNQILEVRFRRLILHVRVGHSSCPSADLDCKAHTSENRAKQACFYWNCRSLYGPAQQMQPPAHILVLQFHVFTVPKGQSLDSIDTRSVRTRHHGEAV
jgi:hypothetical protein